MIEVKVLCPCGTKFKFDTEPVNNLVPSQVFCPACGQDTTDLANADLHQKLPIHSSPAAVVEKPRLRISLHPSTPAPSAQPETDPASAPTSSPPASPLPVPPPVTASGGASRKISPAVAKHLQPVGDRSIWFGVGGALVGGFIGMMIWFLLIKWTHYEIGWIAWGVGLLTGVGARVAGSRPTAALGVFTAVCACVAIVGGQFLAARSFLGSIIEDTANEAYNSRMEYAKEGVAANTDDEIKAFLLRHQDEDGEDGTGNKKEPIDKSQIQEFKEKEQIELQDFVNGKPSKNEFTRQIQSLRDTPGFQFMLFKESFSFFTLLWLFLGMGSAFKLASGASGD